MELRTYPERFVNDSIVLRQFCRLYLESAPDDTTLIRWANQIGPQTVASFNDRAVELARSLKVTRGRKLRVDATVVETNVHHPTDSRLVDDGVRVVSRLLRRAREALGQEATRLGKEAFRTLKPQRKTPDEEAPPESAAQGRESRRRAKGSLPPACPDHPCEFGADWKAKGVRAQSAPR
jgi:transposase, IS5 family